MLQLHRSSEGFGVTTIAIARHPTIESRIREAPRKGDLDAELGGGQAKSCRLNHVYGHSVELNDLPRFRGRNRFEFEMQVLKNETGEISKIHLVFRSRRNCSSLPNDF